MNTQQIERRLERIVIDIRDLVDEVRDYDFKKDLNDIAETLEYKTRWVPFQE